MSFRYAICNETFQDWPHDRVCAAVAGTGYTGLELAPFTFTPLITDVPAPRRAEIRRRAESHGLSVIGLHWLLAKTDGFMLTSPDPGVRQRTGRYLGELERGYHVTTLTTAKEVADALGVRLSDLVTDI